MCWLIFTGKTPYPGLDPGASFYDKLLNGYRMDNPGKCPMIVYRAMSECWAAEPGHRPTFKKLMDLGRYSVRESVQCYRHQFRLRLGTRSSAQLIVPE